MLLERIPATSGKNVVGKDSNNGGKEYRHQMLLERIPATAGKNVAGKDSNNGGKIIPISTFFLPNSNCSD